MSKKIDYKKPLPFCKEYLTKEQDKDLDKMPNQKWHQIVSFIKSGVRIVVATVLLVFSEVIGIIEEMV